MPGALVWEDDGEGTWYEDELSRFLRTNLQPLTKFRQLADAKDAMGKGLHRGSKYHWNIYGDTASQGRELDERTPIPETDIGIDQGELTITEYGHSVPYTGKLEMLARHDVEEIIRKALVNDARKAFDIACHAQFKLCKIRVTPTGGTSTTALTSVTNATTVTTNNVAMGADHIKALADFMQERNIPPFEGDDYGAVSHPTTWRPVKNDLESINQYTENGIGRIFRGEVGRYEGFRFIEQNFIPKGGAVDSTTWDPYTQTADAWDNGKSSWAFFFGADTVAEAIVVPEEIRSKLPGDYGRSKGIAWYSMTGFGLVHVDATNTDEARVVMWDSAA